MSDMAQQLITGLIVAAAASYLLYRLWGLARGRVACGRCRQCSVRPNTSSLNQRDQIVQLVSLELPRQQAHHSGKGRSD